VIRLLDERRYDPPRLVQVEHSGRWWPGLQSAWRFGDDDRGGLAEVEFTVDYEWGRGKHLAGVPTDRLRLVKSTS
jgi:hypothetical protein